MSERKLASIRRIDALNPIEGADKIEVATVGGWKVVCQKGLYKVGELVIYCEIDSWIPTEIAPFLTKGREPREYNGVKGECLRTVKLRGQISQGLLLPLFEPDFLIGKFAEYENVCNRPYPVWAENITDSGFYFEELNFDVLIGLDVTERLGIQKWEAPIPACLAGKVKGSFPSWIPKTDEFRIQNLSNEWDELKAIKPWFVTEKLDGTSFTAYIKGDEFGVCSRNMDLYEDDSNTYWKFVRENVIEEKMRQFCSDNGDIDFAIQGELVGESIQGNRYKLKGQKVFLFNAYSITDCGFFGWDGFMDISDALGIDVVPVVWEHLQFESETIDDILAFAEGKSALNPNTEREGVVFKTYAREKSFKAISNKFLSKEE
jgi:RNA ligase (TIGR02306 family)